MPRARLNRESRFSMHQRPASLTWPVSLKLSYDRMSYAVGYKAPALFLSFV